MDCNERFPHAASEQSIIRWSGGSGPLPGSNTPAITHRDDSERAAVRPAALFNICVQPHGSHLSRLIRGVAIPSECSQRVILPEHCSMTVVHTLERKLPCDQPSASLCSCSRCDCSNRVSQLKQRLISCHPMR